MSWEDDRGTEEYCHPTKKKKGRKGNGVKSVCLGKFSRSITKISSLYVN